MNKNRFVKWWRGIDTEQKHVVLGCVVVLSDLLVELGVPIEAAAYAVMSAAFLLYGDFV